MSLSIIKFVMTAAMRDRILITFLLLVLLASSLSGFFGAATVTEQSAFSLVYKAGALRFVGILGLVLFASFYIRRAFETKEVEYMLSRPVSRPGYLFSHAAAFILIAAIITLFISAVVFLTEQPDTTGWFLWSFSLFIEYMLVVLTALFFALVISSAAGAALACFAFYALGRMTGVLLGIADVPAENGITLVLGNIIEFISVFVPRFDMMAQTGWLVYGAEAIQTYEVSRFGSGFSEKAMGAVGLPWFLYLQGAAYGALLLAATAFDFVRKQF